MLALWGHPVNKNLKATNAAPREATRVAIIFEILILIGAAGREKPEWYCESQYLSDAKNHRCASLKTTTMGTMSFGYHYDEGKTVGYNISVKDWITLWNVAYKDKARIIAQLEANGHEIEDVTRVKVDRD